VCTYKNENAKRFFFSYKNNSFDKYDRRRKKEKKKKKKRKKNEEASMTWGQVSGDGTTPLHNSGVK
jgi:hypothetical protein